jgi:transcriptional regulator with XRE-family HTH domain
MIKPRAALWSAIKEEGLNQREFSQIVGDDPAIVSRIVTGQMIPTKARKIKYAKALNRKVEELFD